MAKNITYYFSRESKSAGKSTPSDSGTSNHSLLSIAGSL